MSENPNAPTPESVPPVALAAIPSARAAVRIDDLDAPWPMRPWIMGAICAVAGLIFSQLIDWNYPPSGDARTRVALAAALVVATLSFVLTVELRRWTWAVGFALGWGAIIGGIAWFSSGSIDRGLFDFPFFSGVFAVLLAAPLFQTVRDEGAWRFPYARLHLHGWTDAVIGAASLFFILIAFLLAWLIAGLFDLIGIEVLKDLLQEEEFGWALAGFAFGSAAGLLRERDRLVGTLQRLVMIILGVLAPVLAAALALFLLSLLGTGLERLWASNVPTTPLMLLAAAGAVLLANAVIGNGVEDQATNRALHYGALVLALAVLPLSAIAAVSMGLRISEYGWTPERIWGAITVGVALAYGLIGLWAVVRGRAAFDDVLRPLQTKLAIALCGVALFLALPIVDFGAISTQSQLARLKSGAVTAERFDWTAMAFDFGPSGRAALERIAKSGPADQRTYAARALKTENRWDRFDPERGDTLEPKVVVRGLAAGKAVEIDALDLMKRRGFCVRRHCLIQALDSGGYLVVGPQYGGDTIQAGRVFVQRDGRWEIDYLGGVQSAAINRNEAAEVPDDADGFDPDSIRLEIRPVVKQQAVIDGKPIGDSFD